MVWLEPVQGASCHGNTCSCRESQPLIRSLSFSRWFSTTWPFFFHFYILVLPEVAHLDLTNNYFVASPFYTLVFSLPRADDVSPDFLPDFFLSVPSPMIITSLLSNIPSVFPIPPWNRMLWKHRTPSLICSSELMHVLRSSYIFSFNFNRTMLPLLKFTLSNNPSFSSAFIHSGVVA